VRFTILALGSRGDVQPYVALGRGLWDRGHRVRFVTFENFEPLARGQGLDFHPVKGDSQALLNTMPGMGLMETGQNPFRMMARIMQTFGRLVDDYIESFSADALRETDAIINQLPGALFGRDLAEALHVPHMIAAVIPLTPTSAFPLPLLATRSLGTALNRFSYMFAQRLVWQGFRSGVRRFRKTLDLKPTSFAGYFRWKTDPVINGFSPFVVPPPPDWGEHVHTTGYWLLDESNWQPSDDLMRFLDAGDAPVFVGFGSMPVRDPQAITNIVLEAVQKTGVRCVLSSGWANLGGVALPESVYCLDYAPYGWLFPKMAVAVHHGGSGTTGFGLRAGIPSVIVPFGADQPYWGKRVADLGVGPQSVPYKYLTADRLAMAIQTAISDMAMRQSASELGAKLRAEDGLVRAVQLIENYASR
jgi:UDP:flavonoid glycosyltransferase YjiC (YdhE family)